MRLGRGASATARDSSQLALKRSGARKEAAVELVEIAARRKEHKAAGDADGDADGAAVELDCETLAWHVTSPIRADAFADAVKRRGEGLLVFSGCVRGTAKRCSFERPRAGPCRAHAAAQGVRLVPYCCPDEFLNEGNAQS